MTLTLLGDVFLGTFLTLVADRVGRRRILMLGSLLMVLSGVMFALFENFLILLFGAVVGVISVTGGDFGPFRSVEESVNPLTHSQFDLLTCFRSILSQLTTPSTRSDVLAWYVTTSTLGSSVGSEVAGRIVRFLQGKEGWTPIEAYHTLFWIYSGAGVLNICLVLMLTDACELKPTDGSYFQVPQEESQHPTESELREVVNSSQQQSGPKKVLSWLSSRLAEISAPTRSIMYKLWLLLALDSLADGMVSYTWTTYYLDTKFHPSKSALGDVTSASYLLSSIGAIFAGPLARKIGLINTMVFTHAPSSAAVLFFPLPPYFWMSAALLLLRTGLNNMDQAPRAAFIAAVVKPQERTAVMGITSMLRTLASMVGPLVTGWLAGSKRFWIAYVVAGAFRLAYDFGLWALFVNTDLYKYESKPDGLSSGRSASLDAEMAEMVDMESLAGSEGSDDRYGDKIVERPGLVSAGSGLQVPMVSERVRSRSPHQSRERQEDH
jgi:MFS family permease